jgi:hypothetical protein
METSACKRKEVTAISRISSVLLPLYLYRKYQESLADRMHLLSSLNLGMEIIKGE